MIGIFQGSMTAKERVLRTFNHEKADRVPIGYFANPGIQKRVAAALGVPADKDAVDDALGVDFKELMPRYTGRPLFSPREGRRVHPLTGAVQRWVPNQDGGYWDHCDFPLARPLQTGPCRTRTISTMMNCLTAASFTAIKPFISGTPASPM